MYGLSLSNSKTSLVHIINITGLIGTLIHTILKSIKLSYNLYRSGFLITCRL
jgi:hypothetical protein